MRETNAEDMVRGKTMSVRLTGQQRWRLERRARLTYMTEGAIMKQALDLYFGPMSGDNDPAEVHDWKEHLRGLMHSRESLLARFSKAEGRRPSPVEDEVDGSVERPRACPSCGNDFAFSALDDGTWKCGACRESGAWA